MVVDVSGWFTNLGKVFAALHRWCNLTQMVLIRMYQLHLSSASILYTQVNPSIDQRAASLQQVDEADERDSCCRVIYSRLSWSFCITVF